MFCSFIQGIIEDWMDRRLLVREKKHSKNEPTQSLKSVIDELGLQ